jgi:homoserine O-succinyltransferase/O-acetyltransferase
VPLTVERPSAPLDALARDRRRRRDETGVCCDQRIRIGLVNNMPDAALAATERQFIWLLQSASADHHVLLRLFALSSTSRNPAVRGAMRANYFPTNRLPETQLDALIVTGAEPLAPSLPEEGYWRELVEVFDFARRRTLSAIFSCLAAHAAVLHWDGIPRVPLPRKLSGVFPARVVGRHALVDGLPLDHFIPHSRFNGLDEAALADKGYTTLVRSDEAGVDLFIKDEASLLIFLQGHPEYDADSLAREFRRDLNRYLAAERVRPPDPPSRYFRPDVLAEVEALIDRSRREPRPQLVDFLSDAVLDKASNASWRPASQRLYGNWLSLIARRKSAVERSLVAAGPVV